MTHWHANSFIWHIIYSRVQQFSMDREDTIKLIRFLITTLECMWTLHHAPIIWESLLLVLAIFSRQHMRKAFSETSLVCKLWLDDYGTHIINMDRYYNASHNHINYWFIMMILHHVLQHVTGARSSLNFASGIMFSTLADSFSFELDILLP